VTTDEAAKAIRHNSGQRAVKTTYAKDVHGALWDLGVKSKEFGRFRKNMTWKKWVHEYMRPRGTYIVLVTKHLIVVENGVIKDTGIYGGLTADEMPARKRVLFHWEIKT